MNPGETVGVQFQLQNVGNIPTTNLVATLQTNGGVIPVAGHGQANYGALAPGGGVGSGQFMFTANSTNGGTVVATLQLQDGPTNLGTVSFTFVMPVVSTFWNNQGHLHSRHQFRGHQPGQRPGRPVSLQQSGFRHQRLCLGCGRHRVQLGAHLSRMTSACCWWGRAGKAAVLMSAAADHSSAAIPVTITFDQNASTPVPAIRDRSLPEAISPRNTIRRFSPTSAISPPYNTNLSVFAGTPANGWWSLYAYDGATGRLRGHLQRLGSVAVTTITPVNQITDLGVAIAASTNQVILGSNVTYTITVTNSGTNATTVLLTNVLGAGLSFVSNTIPAYAPYQQIGQTQYYNSGHSGRPNQSDFGLCGQCHRRRSSRPARRTSVPRSLIRIRTTTRPVASVTVVLPTADVSAAISSSADADTVVVGSNVIYTLTVTNNGPDLALNVVGLLTQGVAGPAGMVFSNNFGGISPGFIATALFTNAPAVTGSLTNTWTVSTDSTDTNPGNNTATLVLAVTYPEPVIAANGVRLLSGKLRRRPTGRLIPTKPSPIAFTLENIGAAPNHQLDGGVAVRQWGVSHHRQSKLRGHQPWSLRGAELLLHRQGRSRLNHNGGSFAQRTMPILWERFRSHSPLPPP